MLLEKVMALSAVKPVLPVATAVIAEAQEALLGSLGLLRATGVPHGEAA